jgi:hypothetical protein
MLTAEEGWEEEDEEVGVSLEIGAVSSSLRSVASEGRCDTEDAYESSSQAAHDCEDIDFGSISTPCSFVCRIGGSKSRVPDVLRLGGYKCSRVRKIQIRSIGAVLQQMFLIVVPTVGK